jgi:Fe2+ transport system protein B
MTSKSQIENQIEAALNSLKNITRAEPAPFFNTRVTARMMSEDRSVWSRMSRVVTSPAIAILSLVLIIFVNVFAVVMHASQPEQSIMPDQAEMAVAEEYNRTANFYYIDNVQP